jgi:hypothetical protein
MNPAQCAGADQRGSRHIEIFAAARAKGAIALSSVPPTIID